MVFRLRVGRKGIIKLPKAVREAVGIDEGDEVIVEVGDGILIKPVRRIVDVEKLRESLRKHVEVLKNIGSLKEPKPGELAGIYLEEEFDI